MKHIVKSSVLLITLFGSTLSAVAGVTGSDPRPVPPPKPSVLKVVLSYFGWSTL